MYSTELLYTTCNIINSKGIYIYLKRILMKDNHHYDTLTARIFPITEDKLLKSNVKLEVKKPRSYEGQLLVLNDT